MKYFYLLIAFACSLIVNGQDVKNTSYTSVPGEKVLRLEFVLPLSQTEAWRYFSEDEKLKQWIAPVVHMNLKAGGKLVTNYDKSKPLTDSSSISIDVINYLDNELLTLKVNLNGNFTKKTQDEDDNLQEVIQLFPIDGGHTKVVSSMIGWGQGADWDKIYSFFVKGNIYTYEELIKLFKKKG
ncbi:SRPBCC domain-containing protein [Dyadobacter sp. MSC1_007]|jgi:uncharacterized protein YndB with AHSA1/START domain|uniref:SRPBCC domain-containing protein n=1 Tax=Dyadobacter sp. MSC1_007 TaxID=2909264 RepID=UPI00202EC063|nr:SRPBCC domain-containing protein [Dyadobacter sp. MSC1_007]